MISNMRILYFGNDWVGLEILKFLKTKNENIIGLVLHPNSNSIYKKELIELFPDVCKIEWDKSNIPFIEKQILKLNPDIILSMWFGYLIPSSIFKLAPKGAINIHPGYLPYNRGKNPNVWAIVDETPAGVALHYIDEGIDSGPIIARKRVESDYTDTADTLYEKLRKVSVEILKENWDSIKNNRIEIIKPKEKGTFHYGKHFASLDEIFLNKKYKAKDLINILRARTFPPNKGVYFQINGKRYYINIKIYEEKI